jgi:hypothetical protein
MVMAMQAARGHFFPLFKYLTCQDLLVGAGTCGDRQAAVRPALSLRAQALRCADDRAQLRYADGAKAGQI